MMPVIIVLYNSFKPNALINTDTFALPTARTFTGIMLCRRHHFWQLSFLNSAMNSLRITVVSTLLLLLCTSIAAWYMSRVNDLFSRIVYYLCIFSMVVPSRW